MSEQSISEQIMTEQMAEQSETESVKESRGGWIYKIVFQNGKHYIGLTTTSIEQRTKEHRDAAKRGEMTCLYKALRKYNMVDSFELIEIDTADSFDELCELEIHYIKEYNSYYLDGCNGYNMTFGGAAPFGYVRTEDDRQRLSDSMKKYYRTDPDARKKCSERTKLYHENNPKAREVICERFKRYFDDPKARQEVNEKIKLFYKNNPDAGKENSDRQRQYYDDHPEEREKRSEKMKRYFETYPDEIMKRLDARGRNKPFDVFKCDGTYIGAFMYQFEAKAFLQEEYGNVPNIETVNITAALSGKIKSSRGFVFKYSDPDVTKNPNEKNIEIMIKFQENSDEIKKNRLAAMGNNKPFDVFKVDGTYVGTFTYQCDARAYLEKEYEHIPNIERVNSSQVLSGKLKSSMGFTFKYSDPEVEQLMREKRKIRENIKKPPKNPETIRKTLDTQGCNKPFDVFKVDGTYIGTFNYAFEAKAYLKKEYGNIPNIEAVKISYVLSKLYKSSKGFTFKYK